MSHLAFTGLLAILVSGASAFADPGTGRERAFRAVRMFGGCAAAVVAGSWLMQLIHG